MPNRYGSFFRGNRTPAEYIGPGISLVGFLMFFSVFITSCMHFGDFNNFEQHAKSSMARALGGMALMIAGGVVTSITHARKMSDMIESDDSWSSVHPDPQQPPASHSHSHIPTAIKVRCRYCGSLNDEEAETCEQCGAQL